jgi:hypothetical protein
MVLFLIAFYYCGRWAFMALRWHLGYMREHGVWKGLLNFYNPFQLWPNIRCIWRDVPGSETVFKRAALWLCVTSVCNVTAIVLGIWWFHLSPHTAP